MDPIRIGLNPDWIESGFNLDCIGASADALSMADIHLSKSNNLNIRS